MLQKHFKIKIAGLIIEIDTPSPRTCIMCYHYLSQGKTDINVKVTKEDIQNEIYKYGSTKKDETSLETLAVYRQIIEKASAFGIFLMHGAVIAIDDKAFMFTAPSGTGKTTHIKKWLKNAKGAYVVNGDKPLIKVTNKGIYACGTPWCGNEHMETNTMVPLKAIVCMERGEENHIEEKTFLQVYSFILQQTYRSPDVEIAKETLNYLLKLQESVSFWHFSCNNLKEDSFHIAYKALMGESRIHHDFLQASNTI